LIEEIFQVLGADHLQVAGELVDNKQKGCPHPPEPEPLSLEVMKRRMAARKGNEVPLIDLSPRASNPKADRHLSAA